MPEDARIHEDDPLLRQIYNSGYDDGVEHVLELMETFINHSVIVGLEPEYIRAVEEMLEDIKNTLDEQ
jgi:hypothetical protein